MKIFCEGIERATAKTGNDFLKVTCVGEDKARRVLYLWDNVNEFESLFNAGSKSFECMFGGDANFPKITSFQVTEADPLLFYDFLYPDDNYAGQILASLVSSVTVPFYQALVNAVFSLPGTNGFSDIKGTFMVVPAAKAFHHDYRYGLLRHTHEVMSFVSRVCSADLYRDTVDVQTTLTGALLHDVGKCYEYSFDGLNHAEYGTGFQVNQIYLGSHLYKGAEMVTVAFNNLIQSNPEYNTQENQIRLEHVRHIILSHHLQRDWGSVPKNPQTLEAMLVFLGDYFSAAFGKFNVIDWSNVDINNMLGATSKYDTFFGFTPLLKKLGETDA